MPITVHVLHRDGRWSVEPQDGTKFSKFSTQREAIKKARSLVKQKSIGQIVIYARNGRIRETDTYGVPPIQEPPGKKSAMIQKAVGKVTRERLYGSDPVPLRG